MLLHCRGPIGTEVVDLGLIPIILHGSNTTLLAINNRIRQECSELATMYLGYDRRRHSTELPSAF